MQRYMAGKKNRRGGWGGEQDAAEVTGGRGICAYMTCVCERLDE